MMSKVKPYPSYSDFNQEWLGELPSHWKVMRTKLLFNLITEPAPIGNSEELLSVYTALGVKPRKDLEARGNKASSTDNYWRVEKGDIIVNKLLAWMGAVGISEYNGVTSPAYDILRANGDVNPYFYNYLFRNPIASREFKRHSRGIMDMRLRLYFTRFGDIKLPQPPLEEQNKIVDYLQFKQKKIDRFIRKKKQLIKLLNEQKAGIINHAVTKGLDPNAKMKPSGIEWLGDIPEHWELVKNKYIHKISMGQSPSSDDYNFVGKGEPFLQGNAQFGKLNPIPKTWCENANKICLENDILLSVRAPIGAVNIANQKFGIGRGLSSISCDSNLMYWFYQFSILKDSLNSIGTGSTYFAISIDDVKNIYLVNPPNEEKMEISEYISEEIRKMDETITIIEKEIALVEEYKTALIAEAVTGKIDVRKFEIPETLEVKSYEELEEELSMVAEDEAEYEMLDEN